MQGRREGNFGERRRETLCVCECACRATGHGANSVKKRGGFSKQEGWPKKIRERTK